MPRVHAVWVASTDEGIEHLVCDIDVGDPDRTALRLRAVCGYSVLPAALVCEPLPRCGDCERYVDWDPPQRARRPRRLRRLFGRSRNDQELPESSHAPGERWPTHIPRTPSTQPGADARPGRPSRSPPIKNDERVGLPAPIRLAAVRLLPAEVPSGSFDRSRRR